MNTGPSTAAGDTVTAEGRESKKLKGMLKSCLWYFDFGQKGLTVRIVKHSVNLNIYGSLLSFGYRHFTTGYCLNIARPVHERSKHNDFDMTQFSIIGVFGNTRSLQRVHSGPSIWI